MVSFFALAALALFPAAIAQQSLTIDSPPSIVACQPTQLTWRGGSPPYFLSAIPAGQASAAPLKQFPNQNGNSFTWIVDLPANTAFTLSLKDSTGQTAFTSPLNVQAGTDSSCANTSVSESGSGGTATPASGSSSSAATPGSSSGASSSGASSSGAASGTSKPSGSTTGAATAASSTTTGKNAASSTKCDAFVLAGVMGLLGAALF